MIKKYIVRNPEVLYSDDQIAKITKSDICDLNRLAKDNRRERVRLCAHRNEVDALHEMIIIHCKGAYVRPHMHIGKTESTHIIDGLVDVIIFNSEGKIEDIIEMGDFNSGKIFYYRMEPLIWHTLIVRSEFLVFHETTNGPFNREDTIFPLWAPEEKEAEKVIGFIESLEISKKLLG